MQPWKTLSKKILLQVGKYLKVESHLVELPDGSKIENWQWVIVPDYVNVLPVTPDGRFLCFKQVKYAVEGTTLATVGGMIDPGESPLEAAKRELREEMGCEARELIFLGKYATDANRGCGTGYLYLGLDAIDVAPPTADDLEEQERISLDRDQLRAALLEGKFEVVSWAATVGLSLAYLMHSSR